MENLALIEGSSTSAGLLIAIGAQNAYVLKQGILKNYVFTTALFCSVVDAILISIGVGGVGDLISMNRVALYIAAWGGAAYLFWYGFRAFKSSLSSEGLQVSQDNPMVKPSFNQTLLTLAAVSLLNPNVYLDTVVLLGTISSQFCFQDRIYFAIGAIATSFIWFFSITYGARFLAPLFEKPAAWKILDFFIGCIMWSIAASLILNIDKQCS